ncbi:tyrosine-type recombinase/integrase [Collimonas silvisoli]|uniref:tyrosine-type recombinase/integrase n=1 Tax=Collimonas silvisoli TaxID=2825884 RepID=UPI0038B36AA5
MGLGTYQDGPGYREGICNTCTFRHSTASRLADAGVDAFLRIQKMMGHKNIASTMKYAHVSAAGLHGLAGVLETASQVTQSKKGFLAETLVPTSAY